MSETKKLRISPTQQVVLMLMRKGHDLCAHDFNHGFVKDFKLWKHGFNDKVKSSTVYALIDKGLIQRVEPKPGDQYWLIRYRLTEEGKG